MEKLKEYVLKFRLTLEKIKLRTTMTDLKDFPADLKNFPLGSCGIASRLLAIYLKENGFGDFDYILGFRNGHQHAWLQLGKLIIDITADQFSDNLESVIVTEDSTWHDQFNGKVKNIIYDEKTKNAYKVIMKELNSTL